MKSDEGSPGGDLPPYAETKSAAYWIDGTEKPLCDLRCFSILHYSTDNRDKKDNFSFTAIFYVSIAGLFHTVLCVVAANLVRHLQP